MNLSHEKILIEGLKEGNVKIFDYVFHLYYSGMVVFAMKYIGEKAIAEDLVQNFFIKLWVKREELNINQSLKSYIFTSLKNSCIDQLRKESTKQKVNEQLIEKLKNRVEPRNLLLESELRDKINGAISKLPPVCRDVFVMNRFEELKPAQIAEKKNISVRTVEKHIGKALKLLRKELSAYLPASLVTLIIHSL